MEVHILFGLCVRAEVCAEKAAFEREEQWKALDGAQHMTTQTDLLPLLAPCSLRFQKCW